MKADSSEQAASSSMEEVEQLAKDLCYPHLRANALLRLSESKHYEFLAPILWKTIGAVAALLEEIISLYKLLSPPKLTSAQSCRVGNAITLLKDSDIDIISFLLSAEIIPLCLRSMEAGSESCKATAAFILLKIMVNDVGLEYICTKAERLFAVVNVMEGIVAKMAQPPLLRLLNNIIGCYLRLSDDTRAHAALRSCLPPRLRDATFTSCFPEDSMTARWLKVLLVRVQGPV